MVPGRGTTAKVERAPGAQGPRSAPAGEGRTPDPATCPHARLQRLGVQEIGVWPYRVHLVVCAACGTTLTTESLRGLRRREGRGVA